MAAKPPLQALPAVSTGKYTTRLEDRLQSILEGVIHTTTGGVVRATTITKDYPRTLESSTPAPPHTPLAHPAPGNPARSQRTTNPSRRIHLAPVVGPDPRSQPARSKSSQQNSAIRSRHLPASKRSGTGSKYRPMSSRRPKTNSGEPARIWSATAGEPPPAGESGTGSSPSWSPPRTTGTISMNQATRTSNSSMSWPDFRVLGVLTGQTRAETRQELPARRFQSLWTSDDTPGSQESPDGRSRGPRRRRQDTATPGDWESQGHGREIRKPFTLLTQTGIYSII